MTTPDQPAQGSTADYCSAVPGQPWHHIETFMGRSELYVRRCSLCGWIDFADLQQQAEAQQAVGRRQATEGWERHWAIEMPDGDPPYQVDSEEHARWHVQRGYTTGVRYRLVGPWTVAP